MTTDELSATLIDYSRLKNENVWLRDENEELKEQLAWFKRQAFGCKSERFVPADGQTALDLGVESAQDQPQRETITYDRTKPARHTPHGREEIPAHLPRKETVVMPDADVSEMEKIGEKVTEQVQCTPPQYFVARIVRPVFAGDVGGVRMVVCAELPSTCNDKGKYGSSFIAHATVAKFEDHTPLYRLRGEIKRDSEMDVAETTLERLPEVAAFWLEPIVDRLKKDLMAGGYIQMDESTVRVMVKPTQGKSKTGHMWVRSSPRQKIVVFDYERHRSGEVARRLLGEYKGILQTDGYVVYDAYSHKDGVVHAGCHAHARRGFEECLQNDKARATHALDVYRSLFMVETEQLEKGATPQERRGARQERSGPIMTEFKQWLDAQIRDVRPKSSIGKAIAYSLGRWRELTCFLEDGRIEISNNLVENRIRTLALGRKNWLFAGSEEAARRMATIYSIQGTCKVQGVNFYKYLVNVLEEIPKRKAGNIDDLLPMNWKSDKQ